MGEDGSQQPGDLKDLVLHEAAVAWQTHRLRVATPAQSWQGTAEDFGARSRAAADFVNIHYDVEGLQRELPARLVELRNREGGRIGK